MGAKTKAKIDAIRNDVAVWRHLINQTGELKEMQEKEMAAKDKAKEAYDAYYLAQGWRTNKVGREEEMAVDPQWKKLSKAYEDKLELLGRLKSQWSLVFAEGKKTKAGIIAQVKDLEAYIAKKEKDKVFFWQKKSVAAAKQFIKEMKEDFDI
jgi:hypothetical protein